MNESFLGFGSGVHEMMTLFEIQGRVSRDDNSLELRPALALKMYSLYLLFRQAFFAYTFCIYSV
jgi:hypothetical protein